MVVGGGGGCCARWCLKGTVPSHDVHKELTGVSHGVLEGLAAGGELGGDGGQLPPRWGSRGCGAARRGLGGQPGQAVRGRQTRGAVGGGVASLAVSAGAGPRLSEGGVAVAEGGLAVLGQRVAPVRLSVTEAGSGVAVARDGVALMAHLAGRALTASPSTDAGLCFVAC